MSAVSLTPKGRTFTRAIIAKSAGGSGAEGVVEYARSRWGEHTAQTVVKAAISAVSTTSLDVDGAKVEFHEQIREASVYGRLSGLRKVEFGVRSNRITNGATGYWVSQANPKPVSFAAVEGSTLQSCKVAAIIVLTQESVKFAGAVTEAALQRDLQRAVTDTWDEAFLAVSNAGIPGEMPASITYGAPTIASSADPAADIAALVAAFDGDFASAYFVTDPKTAAQLAMVQAGGTFAFPDVGPRGGSILGIPVLTSRASPRDAGGGQIALVDPTAIMAADIATEIAKSEHASLQMDDAPDASEDGMVSLWQCNLVAFKAEVFTNWQVQHEGSVAVITGADYAGEG